MIRDKHHFKALRISLVIHALVILILFGTNSSLKPENKLLVIDFRMEDSVNTGKNTLASFKINAQKGYIHQKDRTAKKTQMEEPRNQESTKVEQKQETPVLITPETLETLASEIHPPILAQSYLEAGPVKGKSALASHDGPANIVGETGTKGDVSGVKGAITTGDKTSYGDGTVRSSGLMKADYLRKNFFYIRDMIQKKIIYPALARRMGWEGKVITSFVISSGGHASDIRISESSGYEILDQNALKAINNASPFPKPPVEAQIIIPIKYQLN